MRYVIHYFIQRYDFITRKNEGETVVSPSFHLFDWHKYQ